MPFPVDTTTLLSNFLDALRNGSVSVTGGTVTASAPVLDATQTWNAGAVTFTGIKLNVTDTASAAASLLMDLQVGGASKFSVTKGGTTTIGGQLIASTINLNSLGLVSAAADGVLLLRNNAGTDFGRLQFGGTTSSFPALARSSNEIYVRLADDSAYAPLRALYLQSAAYVVTVGSGTGLTVNQSGLLTRHVYKVTLAKEAFVTAGLTSDVTIATLPAKTVLLGCYADLTATFTLGADTLSMVLGRGSGGAEFLASFDAKTAVGQFGDADAEMGTEMTRAAAIQGGKLGSWSATTTVVCRLTSSATNIGDGATTSLTTGAVTFYLITERLP